MTDASAASDAIPDRWLALSVDSISPLASELLAESLLGLGTRGVHEVDGRLITYLPPPSDPEAFVERARDVLRETTGIDDLAVSWRWQEHRDWSVLWRQGLGPQTITDRLIVTPSWCDPQASEGAVVVTIDPGMAFGTAEHETTRGALRLLDRALSPGEKLLDAGCGSGILAIAAARLGASHVLAVDMDPYACAAALENAAINGVAGSIVIEEGVVTREWLRRRAPFHGILANIQAGVLVPLLGSLAGALESGGWLILGGITVEEWPDVSRSAGRLQLGLEEVDEEGEWCTGWFTRPQ